MKLTRKLIILASLTILIVTMIIALPQQAQKPQIIWADYGSLVLTGPIYNPFYPNTLASDSVTSIMTYAPLALYNPFNNQFYPVLARNWSIQLLPNGSGILTIYLRHGLYWFNGSATIPFTAWDVYAYFYIEDKAFQSYAPFMQPQYADESIRVINNYTIQFLFQTWSPIEWILFITASIPTPWPIWKSVVKVLQGMNSSQALVYSTNITRMNTPYWGIFPYYLSYISTSSLKITLEPQGLLSEWLTLFPLASWNYYDPTFEEFFTGSQYVAAMVAHKATWAGGSMSVKQVALLNSSGFSAYFAPDLSGWGITFNPHVYPFNIIKFRQALCMIFNRSAVAAAWGLNYPNYYPQPVAPETIDIYPLSVRQFLIPCTYNTTSAAQIMQSLGFKEINGFWYLPNGTELSIEVLAPSGWIDWDTMASEAITQMQAFGLDAKLIAQDAGAYWGTTIPSGQYVAALSWTTAFTPSYYAAWEALSWPWWAFGNAISANVKGSDTWPFQWPNGTCTPVT
ncbi:ABC transporter substrate-binding protein, partial [Caldivirga sp.]|uniref:ABC transporter substrate-binding protein n=1 Tax=Caldivirga sp. TaxID=2080243 RepID=UPI0025B7B509